MPEGNVYVSMVGGEEGVNIFKTNFAPPPPFSIASEVVILPFVCILHPTLIEIFPHPAPRCRRQGLMVHGGHWTGSRSERERKCG